MPVWNLDAEGFTIAQLKLSGDEGGPYGSINTDFINKLAANFGKTCQVYEGFVWRKDKSDDSYTDAAFFPPFFDFSVINLSSRGGFYGYQPNFKTIPFFSGDSSLFGSWSVINGPVPDPDGLYMRMSMCLAQ